MLPVIPYQVNELITNAQGQISTYPFPRNIAGDLPKSLRERIVRWMLTNYIWPQVQERQPYEAQWDKLLHMARATWKVSDMKLMPDERMARRRQDKVLKGKANPGDRADVADTVIFDAIDRLNNLNHFISFKDELPMKFQLPKWVRRPMENQWYSPSSDLVDSANSLLAFCASNTNFYRKHWIQGRHHLTYGVSYAISEFEQEISEVPRRDPMDKNKWINRQELTKIGVTFEGISIRKIWLNTRLTPYEMDHQPCPFFFEEIPRFAIVANQYNPEFRPFGYENLDTLPRGEWLFTDVTMQAWAQAQQVNNPEFSWAQFNDPELNVELKWNLYPMLPLQQVELTQELVDKLSDEEQQRAVQQGFWWDFDDDGTKKIPLERYIMEVFGTNLCSGSVEIIRLQKNFYPYNQLPLYGSAHMPDLDSGQYSPAIGNILEYHYVEICKALNQVLDNKDLLNDPPIKMDVSCPSKGKDLNLPGKHNMVNSQDEYSAHAIVDGTGTTTAFLQGIRDQVQTSSKSTDAILGKAMGSRTSATEAGNVFQTAMSGVTTDVNLFNHDISGTYAQRVWDYAGLWIDPDVLQAITGQYGFAIKPEHFQIRLDIDWAIGSTFIDSITRQQNLRYILESSKGDPSINGAYLWRELLEEWKFTNIDKIINDGGVEQQIQEANNQATATLLGDLVMVDPDQDHQIAIKVKVSYLKDKKSVWMSDPKYTQHANKLVEQITMHQMYLQLQMLQQQAAMMGQAGGSAPGNLQPLQNGQQPTAPPPAMLAGQAAQAGGGSL